MRRTATTQQNSDSYVVSFPTRNYKAQFSKSLTNMTVVLTSLVLSYYDWHDMEPLSQFDQGGSNLQEHQSEILRYSSRFSRTLVRLTQKMVPKLCSY